MISSEVQRTLVKSPPELWAELSDPAALARHLGELGEIRIVRTEPESTVEWAAENTTGTVSIKPSGWGTKVTLSVTREVPEEVPAREPAPEPTLEAATAPEPRSEPEAVTAPEPESETEIATTPDPASETEPRRSFFARLFGRRRKGAPPRSVQQASTIEQPSATAPADQPTTEAMVPVAPDAFAAVREVLAPETFAAEHPFVAAPEVKELGPQPAATAPESTMSEPNATATKPETDTDAEQVDDISAELLAAEEASAEEVTAVLTAVLDRLGAAHHRPFSRS
jgi:hypothetical protein